MPLGMMTGMGFNYKKPVALFYAFERPLKVPHVKTHMGFVALYNESLFSAEFFEGNLNGGTQYL